MFCCVCSVCVLGLGLGVRCFACCQVPVVAAFCLFMWSVLLGVLLLLFCVCCWFGLGVRCFVYCQVYVVVVLFVCVCGLFSWVWCCFCSVCFVGLVCAFVVLFMLKYLSLLLLFVRLCGLFPWVWGCFLFCVFCWLGLGVRCFVYCQVAAVVVSCLFTWSGFLGVLLLLFCVCCWFGLGVRCFVCCQVYVVVVFCLLMWSVVLGVLLRLFCVFCRFGLGVRCFVYCQIHVVVG